MLYENLHHFVDKLVWDALMNSHSLKSNAYVKRISNGLTYFLGLSEVYSCYSRILTSFYSRLVTYFVYVNSMLRLGQQWCQQGTLASDQWRRSYSHGSLQDKGRLLPASQRLFSYHRVNRYCIRMERNSRNRQSTAVIKLTRWRRAHNWFYVRLLLIWRLVVLFRKTNWHDGFIGYEHCRLKMRLFFNKVCTVEKSLFCIMGFHQLHWCQESQV